MVRFFAGFFKIGGDIWVALGSLKWWILLVSFISGLVWLCLYQRSQIEQKNAALMSASEQLSRAADVIRERDKLIFSTAQTGGRQWTEAERICLNEIAEAYDRGRESNDPGGVRDVRERQTSGRPFAGSVPGKSAGGGAG